MKKSILVISGLVLTLGLFTSCKKNFDCTCNFPDPLNDVIIPYDDAKKADAEDGCADLEANYQTLYPTTTCVLTAD